MATGCMLTPTNGEGWRDLRTTSALPSLPYVCYPGRRYFATSSSAYSLILPTGLPLGNACFPVVHSHARRVLASTQQDSRRLPRQSDGLRLSCARPRFAEKNWRLTWAANGAMTVAAVSFGISTVLRVLIVVDDARAVVGAALMGLATLATLFFYFRLIMRTFEVGCCGAVTVAFSASGLIRPQQSDLPGDLALAAASPVTTKPSASPAEVLPQRGSAEAKATNWTRTGSRLPPS